MHPRVPCCLPRMGRGEIVQVLCENIDDLWWLNKGTEAWREEREFAMNWQPRAVPINSQSASDCSYAINYVPLLSMID